jgi:hypothetical protein
MYGVIFDDGAKPQDGQSFKILIRGLPGAAATAGLRFQFPDGTERRAAEIVEMADPVVKGTIWEGEYRPPDVVVVTASPTPG